MKTVARLDVMHCRPASSQQCFRAHTADEDSVWLKNAGITTSLHGTASRNTRNPNICHCDNLTSHSACQLFLI